MSSGSINRRDESGRLCFGEARWDELDATSQSGNQSDLLLKYTKFLSKIDLNSVFVSISLSNWGIPTFNLLSLLSSGYQTLRARFSISRNLFYLSGRSRL